MQINLKRKIKIKEILLVLLLFSIVYQSGTVQAANNPDDILFRITRILMIIIPIGLYIISRRGTTKKMLLGCISIVVCFEMLALISFSKFPDSAGTLQYKILLFVLFFFLPELVRDKTYELDKLLYKILLFIAFYTIIFYFIVEIIRIPIPYSIYQKGNNAQYRDYYIYYCYGNGRIPRLSGLFWEPGVYQVYLNLALFLYHKLQIKNKKHLAILLLNILFVQSTSGYILAMLIIGIMIVNKKKHTIQTKTLIGMIIGIIVITGILIVFVEKKNATNVKGDSYFNRVSHASLGLNLFFQHPIFGTGFYNTKPFELLDTIQDGGNSNGLLTWLYTTGTAGLLIAIFPFVYNLQKKRRNQLLYIAFILLINIVEPVYSLSIMVYFLAREYHDAFVKQYRTNRDGIERIINPYENTMGNKC